MPTEKQIDAALDEWFTDPKWREVFDQKQCRSFMARALAAAEAAAWEPIETAPKGNPGPYLVGPSVLGVSVGDSWTVHNVVAWRWHKNAKTGAWVSRATGTTWVPDYWVRLPTPPQESKP